ncbi:hypothetical protein AAVH_30778, partial [Aphelenchoides avenae]
MKTLRLLLVDRRFRSLCLRIIAEIATGFVVYKHSIYVTGRREKPLRVKLLRRTGTKSFAVLCQLLAKYKSPKPELDKVRILHHKLRSGEVDNVVKSLKLLTGAKSLTFVNDPAFMAEPSNRPWKHLMLHWAAHLQELRHATTELAVLPRRLVEQA